MNTLDFDGLMEAVRSGSPEELHDACDEIINRWRVAPVVELLALKQQFAKLGMEHREAHLEEALISVAEKRPGPFTAVASDPAHPAWRAAIEVLSMLDDEEYLDLFISLIPSCPEKELCDLVRAIAMFRCEAAVDALKGMLKNADGSVMLESVLALKRCGLPGMTASIREILDKRLSNGTDAASMVEAVLSDMECEEGVRRGGL